MSKEEKFERDKEIRRKIIELFKSNGLNFMEARGILSDVSRELAKMSERTTIQ